MLLCLLTHMEHQSCTHHRCAVARAKEEDFLLLLQETGLSLQEHCNGIEVFRHFVPTILTKVILE